MFTQTGRWVSPDTVTVTLYTHCINEPKQTPPYDSMFLDSNHRVQHFLHSENKILHPAQLPFITQLSVEQIRPCVFFSGHISLLFLRCCQATWDIYSPIWLSQGSAFTWTWLQDRCRELSWSHAGSSSDALKASSRLLHQKHRFDMVHVFCFQGERW